MQHMLYATFVDSCVKITHNLTRHLEGKKIFSWFGNRKGANFYLSLFIYNFVKNITMQTTITSELIITNSYLAEINFTANAAAGQRIYFKDIPTLSPRDGRTSIQTVGLEAYCDNDLSFSPSGAPLISAANMATLLVTLAVGSREVVYLIPANSLRSIIQSGVIRRFYNLPINIVKSYVQVVNAGVSAGESICFNFYYREVKK